MKILFVSEDSLETETIRRMIKNQYKDLDVVMCADMQGAIEICLNDGPFGFYILDCGMKHEEPAKVAEELIDIAGSKPFLFLGTETMITDRIPQEIYQSNDSNDSLFVPVERDELKIKVDQALQWAKQEEYEQSVEEVNPEDFIPMKIKAFYLFTSFPHDIYMEITTTRYLKVFLANQTFTVTNLHAYAKKNIRYLYVKKDDQLRYLEEESKKCLKAMEKTSPLSSDFHVVQLRSINIIHQYIQALGVNPSVFKLVDKMIETLYEFSEKRFSFADMIVDYPIHYEGIASKSLLAAYISSSLSKSLGWTSITSKGKLFLSCILMDYSLEDDQLTHVNSLNDYRIKQLNEMQLEYFKQHPIKAGEIARHFSKYPDVDFLVENHHELPNRKGFPTGVGHLKLTKMCSIFNIAQHIAADLDGHEINNEVILKTIRGMGRDYNAGTFKDPLKSAKDVLKVSKAVKNKINQTANLDKMDDATKNSLIEEIADPSETKIKKAS